MKSNTKNKLRLDFNEMGEVLNDLLNTSRSQGFGHEMDELEIVLKSFLTHLSKLGHEADYLCDEANYILAIKTDLYTREIL